MHSVQRQACSRTTRRDVDQWPRRSDDDDDAATVIADERNDNEAAATPPVAMRSLAQHARHRRDLKIPTHVAVLKDIHGGLQHLLNARSTTAASTPTARRAASSPRRARSRGRVEFFASDYTGLFRQGTRTELDSLLNGGRAADGRFASLVLGKAKHSKLFPLVAIVHARQRASGNLPSRAARNKNQYAIDATHRFILAGRTKTSQAERDFFAHGSAPSSRGKSATAATLGAFEKYSGVPRPH